MKKQKQTNVSMDGKVCIVTGANSGVGYETSRQFLKHGAHVVMICRSKERGEQARDTLLKEEGGKIDLLLTDLSLLEEVRTLAKTLLSNYPKIHVLVCNAGMQSNIKLVTSEGFEMSLALNYLSPFLLTQMLVERIKESAPARIVQVSSSGHRFGGFDLDDMNWEKRKYKGLKSYGQSKIAINLYTAELAERLKGSGVTINAAHPGEVHSNISMNNGKVYKFIRKFFINPMLKPTSFAGEAMYYLAASPDLENTTGKYFNMTILEKPWKESSDRELGKKLWDVSEKLVELS